MWLQRGPQYPRTPQIIARRLRDAFRAERHRLASRLKPRMLQADVGSYIRLRLIARVE